MKKIILILLLCIPVISGFSLDYIKIDDSDINEGIGQKVLVYQHPSLMNIGQVIHLTDSFQLSSSKVVSLGVSENYSWLKVPLHNNSNKTKFILDIDFPILDEVCFYFPDSNSNYHSFCTGEQYSFSTRKNESTSYLFDIELKPNEKKVFYFRIRSGEQMNLPVILAAKESFMDVLKRDIISAVYFGIILVMFFYNSFIYFTTKDLCYAYYVSYIFLVGLVQFTLHGYSFKFFWPESSWLALHSLYIINALTAFASIKFFQHFIGAEQLIPKLNKGFYFFLGLYVIEVILSLTGNYNQAYGLMNIAATLLAFYLIIVSIVAIRKKSRTAKFFLLSWMFFLGSIVLFVLKDVGVIPYNIFTSHILQIGSGLEVVLLSFGLADSINILKREKEESQNQALAASMKNERLIREQNAVLETKVKERTAVLESTLTELKKAQTKLVDQEKMASLGQLTAGIAHEINNPINFVTSNVNPLRRDIEDVMEIIDKYDSLKNTDDVQATLMQIEKLKEDLELDFVRKEIDSLINGISEGANRTAEIVKGLKLFSRMDEQDLKSVDLIDGIESTLKLLNGSFLKEIEVIKEYNPIPRIECYAGKLNQVFMNVLNNSIHAIEMKEGQGTGEIHIRTKDIGEFIQIEFQDNGIGMTDDQISKIYEPFFTTKDVGSGTGLGLSITLSIIDKHNGNIECISEKGNGTTFILTLPKVQQ